MRVYPAIVPPPSISQAVSGFSNLLAAAYPNVSPQRASGPHITLRAPQYPESLETWLHSAAPVIAGFKPFQISIGEPTFLARGVLVLRTTSPQLTKLNQLLATALATCNHPGITYYDYDLYTPHITLAYCPDAVPDQRAHLYQQVLSDLLPLPAFTTHEISVFVRDDQDFRYRLGSTIPLV